MQDLFLGAINIKTNNYTSANDALKTEKYKCPDVECGKEVILRKGSINRAHFAHLPNSDCRYYTPHPSESQIHIDAKQKIRTLLLNQTTKPMEILTRCKCCKDICDYYLLDIQDVKLEWRFKINIESGLLDDNGSLKIADIACFNSDGLLCLIIEILNTHAQKDRPEPWVELSAKNVIENTTGSFRCCRGSFICEECETRPYHKCPYCIMCGEHTKGLANKCVKCAEWCIQRSKYVEPETPIVPEILKKCITCEKMIKGCYKRCYDCYKKPITPTYQCKHCKCKLGEAWMTSCKKCWYRMEK